MCVCVYVCVCVCHGFVWAQSKKGYIFQTAKKKLENCLKILGYFEILVPLSILLFVSCY